MTEVTELKRPEGEALNTKEVLLNLGPQHPSTHGVLRLVLELDGEYVERVDPHIGYLHRGTEKLAESFTYTQIFPLTDRLDYLCPPSNNLAFALAVEKLLGIEAPIRAQYIRVMMAELARISGHLLITGALPMDLGAMTALLYVMREREMIMDLLEMITGARMHTSYCRVGGVREDLPDEFFPKIREFCDVFPNRIRDYERLLDNNRVFLNRTQGIGVISPEDAIDLGLSGPNLRASGVDWDIRRDEPYEIYDRLDFNVITRQEGDCFARWQCRVDEMRESIRIIEQCMDRLPRGQGQGALFDGGADPAFRPVGLWLRCARGRGLFGDRGPKGRARVLYHQRRIAEAVPHEGQSTVLREPPGAVRGEQRPLSRRHDRRSRQPRPGHGRGG
jgi:NADH-quinone oxidoreductase subunit D